MKTLFKYVFIGLLTVSIVLPANAADTGTVSAAFAEYKEKILAVDTCIFKDYIFTRGTAIPKTGSSNSVIYSKRKAKLNATQKLYDFVINEISLSALKTTCPASMTAEQNNRIRQGFSVSLNISTVKIKNLTEIYSDYNGEKTVVVIAIPWVNIEPYLIKDYSQIMCIWQNQIASGNSTKELFVYYDLCLDENL